MDKLLTLHLFGTAKQDHALLFGLRGSPDQTDVDAILKAIINKSEKAATLRVYIAGREYLNRACNPNERVAIPDGFERCLVASFDTISVRSNHEDVPFLLEIETSTEVLSGLAGPADRF